jgi:deoxyribodipyrimidine photo-lyase
VGVPEIRISTCNDRDVAADGDYVLYWMHSHRRLDSNFALERAVEWCDELGKPLVVFEGIRAGYRWASDRLHTFMLEGMKEHEQRLRDTHVTYFPWVEREVDGGKGLLAKLSEYAAVVVTDDYPAFMLPRMTAAAAKQVACKMEKVDSNGIYPMYATDREFTRAHSFRRHLQKTLRPHLHEFPKEHPLVGKQFAELDALPTAVTDTWQSLTSDELADIPGLVAELPIDHSVGAVELKGGPSAARDRLVRFLEQHLDDYGDGRNHPDDAAASGLSPYLHFGHISAHEVFRALTDWESWNIDCLAEKANGKREGWWGMSKGAESFLDEFITWREIGFNKCVQRPDDYDDYESLPDWAKTTLAEHADDKREYTYSLEVFESAATHDEVWNAAQNELLETGTMHNYLRMLWGKKILHWTESPQKALEIMEHLNNKYALDGRDPNSYSGIFWVLGRFDRAWGPEREIFGKIRYMTSKSTKSKLRLSNYLDKYAS